MPLHPNLRPGFFSHYREMAGNRELIEIYISMMIRTLAFSMIGIFIPIYLITKGNLSLQQVLIFYLVWAVGMVAFYPLAGMIASKIGFKHTMLLSSPVYIAYFILLMYMESVRINYIAVAGVCALANALFWMAFHTHFAKVSDGDKRGEEIGVNFIILLAAGILGPFVGGLIITYFGFLVQFALSSILLLASTLPLFFTEDGKDRIILDIRYIFQRTHLRDFFRAVLVGARFMAEGVVWPLFLFFILKKIIDLGAISSVAALMSALSAVLIGKLSDRHSRRTLMRIGGLLDAGVWAVRTAVTSVIGLFIATSLGGMVFKLVEIPFDARMYHKAVRENIMGFMMVRELGIGLGRALILILAVVLSLKGVLYSVAVFSLFHAII